MRDLCACAYNAGFHIFDTAMVYGNQGILGDALNAFAGNVAIVTKIHQPAIASSGVAACVAQILAELQADTVDTVLIHAPKNVDHVSALRDLKAEQNKGRIAKIGVSNYTKRHLEHLAAHGLKPDVIQTEIHPYLQETALVDYCNDNGIAVMGHTAFANGQVFADQDLAHIAADEGLSVGQAVLGWAAARNIVPVVSTTAIDRMPQAAGTTLSGQGIARIAALNTGKRICNNPAWAEFDD